MTMGSLRMKKSTLLKFFLWMLGFDLLVVLVWLLPDISSRFSAPASGYVPLLKTRTATLTASPTVGSTAELGDLFSAWDYG